MLTSITPAEARQQNRVQSVEEASATDLIGRRGVDAKHPIAFLVEAKPHYTIPPHFHDTPQFQIFVRGGSKVGKHSSDPVTVHYVDAATPYGPIVGDDQGYAFLTMRQYSKTGYHEMPASRDLMKGRRPGRTRQEGPVPRPNADRPTTRVLFEEPDGVAALELCAPAGALLPRQDYPHGGAFILLIGGSAELGGQRYEASETACFWVDRDEAAPAITAGPEGAWALFLSFSTET
jgi:hypothetical protein